MPVGVKVDGAKPRARASSTSTELADFGPPSSEGEPPVSLDHRPSVPGGTILAQVSEPATSQADVVPVPSSQRDSEPGGTILAQVAQPAVVPVPTRGGAHSTRTHARAGY